MIVTILITEIAADAWQVSDDGGLCGAPETVRSRDEAHAAADQRVRVYTLRGLAVLPWSTP